MPAFKGRVVEGHTNGTNSERDRLLNALEARVDHSPDQSQQTVLRNLLSGLAPLAQVGTVLLAVTVLQGLTNIRLMLFTAHPVFNVVGFIFLIQAILVLQPTRTPSEKATGTTAHAVFHSVALLGFIVGLSTIEINKFSSNGAHFKSSHSIVGLVTYFFMLIVALVGFTQYYTPALYGGVENAKRVWKYHRACGYVLLVLILTTIITASETGFNKNAIHIPLWVLTVTSLLVLLGTLPGLSLSKLGLIG